MKFTHAIVRALSRHLDQALCAMIAISLHSLPSRASAQELVAAGLEWKYWKGTTSPSPADVTAWRQLQFIASDWSSGRLPLFFGRPFQGTELADMRGAYSSVYLRQTFQLDDPSQVNEMVLSVLSDDGFVAWLNGKEIARHNVPEGELGPSASALEPATEPIAFESYYPAKPWEILQAGQNVLAIHAFNYASSQGVDFAIDARLSISRDSSAPRVVDILPAPGSTVDELIAIEIVFDEPVQGIEAEDLIINGAPATALNQPGLGHYVFTVPPQSAGPVAVAWKAGHGITDVLGRGNPFEGGSWSCTLNPELSRHNLAISEFMADNDRTLYDDDCDNSDWIEIHNSGTSPVNLLGWSLTDDRGNLGKWRFPNFELEGQAYLIVFASQKNKTNLPVRIAAACRTRTNSVAAFHTNFKLDPEGEYLALAAPDGEVISEFGPLFPPQSRDVSFGGIPGSPGKNGYFERATPRAANAAAGAGFTREVAFSRPSGTFIDLISVQLTTAETNAQIYFTLDGTFPSDTNRTRLSYSQPLTVSNTVQVRALAVAPGLLPSSSTSATFLRLTNDAAHMATFKSTLPIILMTTLKTVPIRDSINTPVHFSIYEPRNGQASLLQRPVMTTRGGAKTRGSSTGGQPQANFAIEWWDELDQDKDLPVLGMPEGSEWVLYAPNEYDPALIHNPFTMELSHQMNFSAPRTRFVEVYYNRGGQLRSNDWNGVYVLMEKPGLSRYRTDAPKAQPEDVEFPEVTGSYLFKTDRNDPGDAGFAAGGNQNMYVEPKEREMKSPQRAPQLAYLNNYFRALDLALRPTNVNYRHPVLGYRGYIELTNWIDFHILEMLSGQVDAVRLSTYFYKRRNGKLEYGPRWDYDRAWESKADSRDDNPRVWDTGGGGFGPPWWNRVLLDRDAWQLWIDRWDHFRRSALSRSNMFAVIDRMTNEVSPSQPREAKRWTATVPRTSYRIEIGIMKTWISNRLDWIDAQFARTPSLSWTQSSTSPGFRVTIHMPAGVANLTNATLFYTLDGSDPRPEGGTNPPTALRYTEPISVSANARVFARLRDVGKVQRSGPLTTSYWSAPAMATLVVTPPQLAATEIMFHPEPPPPGSPYSAGDFEFIELKNISVQPVELNGFHFIAGIGFRFGVTNSISRLNPGERVLVVRNQSAFLSRNPGVANIAGEFDGNLADEGERLALAGPVEEPIFDFVFGDGWQKAADGLGFSLVLADETTPLERAGEPGRWRLSIHTGGSPGLPDPAPPAAPPRVKINELSAHAPPGTEDWIEFHNPEITPSDISGWWLSDSFNQPRKFRLPPGTVVPPQGYLLLPAKLFDLPDGAGFAFGANGDSAWLFSANSEGGLTGWVHGFDFGASPLNSTFGRFSAGDGSEHFVLQSQPTPGTANSLPASSPLVFSEVMPNRSELGRQIGAPDEFIELINRSNADLALFDPLQTHVTWRLRGDLDYDFPPGTVLRAGAALVLASFDPARDPIALAAFRARYGLPTSVTILGPWKGGPGDGAISLKLLRPGLSETGSGETPPYFIADQLDAPALTASAATTQVGHAAFARLRNASFANDSSNWITSSPTPGEADQDLDGLPDDWEEQFRLLANSAAGDNGADADPDGDGFSNLQELRNQTNPRDASSALRVRAFPAIDGAIRFVMESGPGRVFLLETSATLEAGLWREAQILTTSANGVLTFIADSPAAPARYYRLRMP